MSHAALASKSPQGNLAAAKSLRSSFNLFSLVSPRWLYQCTKAESDNSVNRVDGCDCVNSGRARTCRQALPSGLFDSRQAASGRISDLHALRLTLADRRTGHCQHHRQTQGNPHLHGFKSSHIVVLQLKVATDPGVDALQSISFDEMDSSHFTSAKISRWYWMKRERHS